MLKSNRLSHSYLCDQHPSCQTVVSVCVFVCSLALPYASHAVFVGTELGFYKLWSDEFGFSVTIDNAANIGVTVTKHHANHTCGLCGNFNRAPDDDYTAQEGMFVTVTMCERGITGMQEMVLSHHAAGRRVIQNRKR